MKKSHYITIAVLVGFGLVFVGPLGHARGHGRKASKATKSTTVVQTATLSSPTLNTPDPPETPVGPSYCVFGQNSVNLGPVTKVGGSVGSNGSITFGGMDQAGAVEGNGNFVGGTNVIADHITMNGFVNMAGGTHVTNDVNAGSYIAAGVNTIIGFGGAGNAAAGGNVTLIGGDKVHGNVDSGGNVALTISTTHVDANLTAAGTFTGPGTVGGTISAPGVPTPPLAYTPVSLPPATPFVSGGANVTNPGPGGTTLPPMSYGAFNVTGATTSFTFTAGDYYFDSFSYQSTFPKLIFDVTGGKIRVFVTGDISFRQSAKITVVGGSAADVFVETHGNFTTQGGTVWNGTVFAPNGTIHIAKTNVATGAFWGLVVETENDLTINCEPFVPPPPVCPPYCIFGADSVILGPVTRTHGGSVGSNGDITVGGSSQLGGVEGGGNYAGGTTVNVDHITMNGFVNMGGGTHVTNNVNAGGYITAGTTVIIGFGGAGNAAAGGNVTLIGGDKVHGNVDSGGNVALTVSTTVVDGNVTAAGTITGPGTIGGTATPGGVPTPPLAYTPVVLPPATAFTSGGPNITINPGAGGTTLPPGCYGAFNIAGATTSFTFTAGNYYFDSFNYQSTFPNLVFDVTGGKIQIFVTGNVDFRANATITVVGGTAADVFVETHGNFTTQGGTVWNGVVFAPYGQIYIAKTNDATGWFWGETVVTENDLDFHCVDFCPFPISFTPCP